MQTDSVFIVIAIIILIAIVVLVFIIPNRKYRTKKLTPLAGLAFGFVLAGLYLDGDQWLGYSLLGVGIILAIIDMVRKSKAGQ